MQTKAQRLFTRITESLLSDSSRLMGAVFRNDIPRISQLLDKDPNLARDSGALWQGIGWSRRAAVMLLLKRGADVNGQDGAGNHPLRMALLCNDREIFFELIKHGSDPSRVAGVVSLAAWSGREDVLQYLHAKGFKADEQALPSAVGRASVPCVQFLLDRGVDARQIDLSKPLRPMKGVIPEPGAMERIREMLEAKQTEQRRVT